MLGFLQPTLGRASIAGFDCWAQGVEARKRVAYLPGELRLYDTMTGRRLVTFLGQLRGDPPGPEVDALAKKLDIDIDRPLTHMSSGMKRKVALLDGAACRKCRSSFSTSRPTRSTRRCATNCWTNCGRRRARGQAVLFSSHVLHEVEAVCDRVAILRRGELVHLQDMSELREGRTVTARLTGPAPRPAPTATPLPPDAIADGHLNLTYRGPLPALLDWLARQPLADLKIEPLGLGPIYRRFHG